MSVTAVDPFNKAVTKWIREDTWPRGETLESVVVVSKVNSSGTVLRLHSAFSYLEIDAIYHNDTGSLADVQIRLVGPGETEGTTVATANLYPISTNTGKDITFNLDSGVIRGQVSFQLRDVQDSQQNIFITYGVNLPFAGELEDTINIDPTVITEAGSASAKRRLEDTVQLTHSEQLKLVKETFSGSETIVIGAPDRAAKNQQALLVKFSSDLGHDGVAIEAYHLPPSVWSNFPGDMYPSISPLPQWKDNEKNFFLEKLELYGSIDPETIVISANLYGYVPKQGRTRLTAVKGPLLDGVPVVIDVIAAKGQGVFTASKPSGKHVLSTDIKVKLNYYPEISTLGPLPISELPF